MCVLRQLLIGHPIALTALHSDNVDDVQGKKLFVIYALWFLETLECIHQNALCPVRSQFFTLFTCRMAELALAR